MKQLLHVRVYTKRGSLTRVPDGKTQTWGYVVNKSRSRTSDEREQRNCQDKANKDQDRTAEDLASPLNSLTELASTLRWSLELLHLGMMTIASTTRVLHFHEAHGSLLGCHNTQ